MDPVSVGSAAAVLLATKGGGALAGEGGKAAWAGLGRLVALVRGKFAGDRPAGRALEEAQAHPNDPVPVQRLAETLVQHGDRDPGFLQALAQLVEEARRDRQGRGDRLRARRREFLGLGRAAGDVDRGAA